MNIGTIGTGTIVERFLEAVRDNEGAECIGVYSRTMENAQKLGGKFGIKNLYDDYETMLDNSEINFIYVASPNSLHYQYCVQAMEKGKNVICEKPFTSNSKELEELIDMAKAKGVFLFEAITTVHLPNIQIVKEKLKEAYIGDVRIVRCNYTQYSERYNKLKNGITTNAFDLNFSGGALVDLNIYNLHFVMHLFGMPERVIYVANKHESGIDTSGIALLVYKGFIAECCGSKDAHGDNSCTIEGEEGYIRINSQASLSKSVTIVKGQKEEDYNVQEQENPLYYELKEFVSLYQNQDYKKCYELLDYSKMVVQVMDEARKEVGLRFPAD